MRFNVITKFFVALFIFIVIWQIFKWWSSYREKSELVEVAKEIVQNLEFPKILITVYYESLCPDSRSFITRQLVPTFDILQNYVEVDLVPYGKAETRTTNGDYTFECQHGPVECEANIIHACTINTIKQDLVKQIQVISCMIKSNIHAKDALKTCAGDMNEYKAILNCSQTIEGRKLLMRYGELTKNLKPAISFIPTITLDHDLDNQILILKDLLRQVCKRIKVKPPPQACNS